MKKINLRGLFVGMMVLALLVGCAPKPAPSITIESAWGMPSSKMPTAGAMFMLIKNAGSVSDHLISGSSPACASIEVHETVMLADGTTGMNLVSDPVEIPASGQVELKSGGMHIMCIMKTNAFVPGATVNLTLKFEKSGEITVPVELRAGL